MARLEVQIVGDASSFKRALGEASGHTSKFGAALGGLAKAGAFAAGGAGLGGLAVVLKAGIGEFAQSAKVAAQTSAVIKSTGGAAHLTATQVNKLATSIMKYSGIDDEAIKSGENMLLTFTNVRNEVGKGNKIFDQATKAAVDMSVAMGTDAKSSALTLGKALNDPAAGLSKLTKQGVAFTEAQKNTIKAMQASGNTMGAQKIILAELNKEFGGSAKAVGDTLPGQLNKLKESFNNMAGDLVGKAMPSLTKFAAWFSEEGMPKIGEFLGALSDKIGPVIDGLVDAFKSAGPGIMNVLTPIGNVIRDDVVPIFLKLGQIGGEAIRAIGKVLADNGPAIHKIFANLGIVIKDIAAVALPILKVAFTVVLPVAIGVAIKALELVSGAFRLLANVVTGVISGILGGVDLFLGGLQAMFQAATHIPFIGDKFRGVAGAIGDARESVRGLREAINHLQGKSVKVLVNLRYDSNAGFGRPGDGIIGADGLMPVVEKDIAAIGRNLLTQSGGRTAFGGTAANPGGLVPRILDDLAFAQSWGLHLTSGFRPGAITSTGHKSLHSVGRAIDVAGSPSSMAGFARAEAHRPGIQELLYTPVGGWYPGVGWTRLSGQLAKDHFSHVHVGVFDKGGILAPGLTLAMNKTGKPEAVVPLSRGVGGGDVHVHFHGGTFIGGDKDRIAEDLRPAIQKALRRDQQRNGTLGFT